MLSVSEYEEPAINMSSLTVRFPLRITFPLYITIFLAFVLSAYIIQSAFLLIIRFFFPLVSFPISILNPELPKSASVFPFNKTSDEKLAKPEPVKLPPRTELPVPV